MAAPRFANFGCAGQEPETLIGDEMPRLVKRSQPLCHLAHRMRGEEPLQPREVRVVIELYVAGWTEDISTGRFYVVVKVSERPRVNEVVGATHG